MIFPIETPDFVSLAPSLQSAVQEKCRNAITQEAPFFLHMMGIPGSGKSSLADALAIDLANQNPSLVGFDRLMKSMPEYQAEADLEKSFALYELPARAAGYWLVKNLISLKANIIFDNSASVPAHVDLLRFAKEQGYVVAMAQVSAEPEIVKERIKARQIIEGRYTPLAYVDERLAVINQLVGEYRNIADVFVQIVNNESVAVQSTFFKEAGAEVAMRIRALRPATSKDMSALPHPDVNQ